MAFRYKWSLIGSFACSVMVAILWGANLGSVYPFVEIIFNKQNSLHQWVDDQVDEAEQNVAKANEKIHELKIFVGSENPFSGHCSTIMFPCEFTKSRNNGIVGLIGPMRMDYSKNYSLMKHIHKILENSLDFVANT